ncbi:MAG: hypothetical protein J7647_26255 [Cyanobacteria bacterium SBLK]|nr:hypothetical protein [Cyanobacteria bacterium SBLK]
MMYSDLDEALQVVKSEAGIGNSNRDIVLTNELESSKGTLNGNAEYRPYIVAAAAMMTAKGEQTLVRADGDATFRQNRDRYNLQPAIEGQLRKQLALDSQQGTEVPIGWNAREWLDDLQGKSSSIQTSETVTASYMLGAMVG